jgi:hypothetical protein
VTGRLRRFPKTRADGTFTVAAQYRIAPGKAESEVAALMEDCLRAVADQYHLNDPTEFRSMPRVESRHAGMVEVVFEGAPTARLWKAWMVYAVGAVGRNVGIVCSGFYDRVANAPHHPGQDALEG